MFKLMVAPVPRVQGFDPRANDGSMMFELSGSYWMLMIDGFSDGWWLIDRLSDG